MNIGDRRIVTLLFSDMVDSTRVKNRGSDFYARRLERHRELIRSACAQHSGSILQFVGDGTLVEFPGPVAAVETALGIQRSFFDEAWEKVPVRLRIGLHQGEVLETGKTDVPFVGLALDVAARIQSLALPDQILMSSAVAGSARETLPANPDATWRAHGYFRFKGVEDEALEIFEVGWNDRSPLKCPPDAEKALAASEKTDQAMLGWRPGAGEAIPNAPDWCLDCKLGEGGFGEVWLASHSDKPEQKVFKFCFHSDRRRSFQVEKTMSRYLAARLGARGDLVPIDIIHLDGFPYYIASEYVAGGNLMQWSEAAGGIASIPFEQRLTLLVQTARAAAAAHGIGVIHKDIKPANVLVDDSGGIPRARLIDFGIGAMADPSLLDDVEITRLGLTGKVLADNISSRTFTRLYAPPEYLTGAPASVRGDIYALGVLLYQLVIGDLEKPLPTDWRTTISDDLLAEDIARCVAGNPENRFASADDLAKSLASLPERRVALDAARASEQRAIRRQRLTRIGLVAGLCLTLVTAASIWGYIRATRAEEAAKVAEAEAVSQRNVAESARESAERERQRADESEQIAINERNEAELQRDKAQRSEHTAVREREEAERQRNKAEQAELAAVRERKEAERQRDRAEEMGQIAVREREEAERQRDSAQLEQYRLTLSEAERLWRIGRTSEAQAQLERAPERWHGWELGYLNARIKQKGFTLERVEEGGLDVFWTKRNGKLTGIGLTNYMQYLEDGIRTVAISPWFIKHRQGGFILSTVDTRAAFWSEGETAREILVVDRDSNSTEGVWTLAPDGSPDVGWFRDGVFLADGRLIWTDYKNRDIARVWDPVANKTTHEFKLGDDATIYNIIAASPKDANCLAAAFGDDLALLNVVDGSFRQRLWQPTFSDIVNGISISRGINVLSFSPSGDRLAAGCNDGRVRLWDMDTGEQVDVLEAHVQPVRALAFSPDGRWLASGDSSHRLWIWDLTVGKPDFAIDLPIDKMPSSIGLDPKTIAFSPAGDRLAVLADMTLFVYQTQNVSTDRELAFERFSAGDFHFLPDGRLLTIPLVAGNPPTQIWRLDPHEGGPKSLTGLSSAWPTDITADGRWLYGLVPGSKATPQPHLLRFDLSKTDGGLSNADVLVLGHSENDVLANSQSVALSPDGQTAYVLHPGAYKWESNTTDLHRRVRALDMVTGAERWVFHYGDQDAGHALRKGTSLALSDDGAWLAVSWFGPDESLEYNPLERSRPERWYVTFLNAATGEVLHNAPVDLPGEHMSNQMLFLSDNQRLLIYSKLANEVVIMSEDSAKPPLRLQGHDAGIVGAAVCPDGYRVATASVDRSVRIWDTVTGHQLMAIPDILPVNEKHQWNRLAFSPDGRYLAIGLGEGRIALLDSLP